MAGVKTLRRILLGRETTAGNNVVTTQVWRGTGTLEDAREVVMVEEDVGYMSGTDRSYTANELARLSMEDTPATYEQILHLLEAGIKTVGTGVHDTGAGTGTGYVFTYALPTTAQATPAPYSIEMGDDQQAEESSYCVVESFNLSGSGREAVTMSADWVGRTVAPTTFTTTQTLPTVEEIIFGKGAIYIDTIGGTFGGNPAASTLLGFDLSVTTGFVPVFTADGNLYFTFVKQASPEITCNLTFEHDTTAVAELVKWRAETPWLLRLRFDGSTLTTAGTTYTKKTLIIDLAGKWQTIDKIGEQDGNDIRAGTFVSKYDETAADWGKFIVVTNSVTTVP
jgi:hypothetical protein